jgi:hypothetical protein
MAAADARLVGDDDWKQADRLRRAAQLEDAGQKLEILDAPDIILVDVDDPVAVEEERIACVGYRFAPGVSPSPIFWRYTLQPWVVPCTSIFRIFSSREVCAVTKQLLNRYQSYDLESPLIKVLS